MGRKRKNFTLLVIIAFVPLIALAYFLSLDYSITDLGFDSQIATDIMSVAPGLFLFLINVAIISQIESGHPAMVGGFAFGGVGLVLLIQELYDINVITDSIIGQATILQVQELVLVASILLGGVVWATGKR